MVKNHEESVDEEPEYSFVTNSFVTPTEQPVSMTSSSSTSTDLATILSSDQKQVALIHDASAGVSTLHSRSYQGLDPRINKTDVAELQDGQSGTAWSYQTDQKHS
mmetsp:Transcript_2542/g.3680  ORF Transcript_2542/g.3680 Transcript_2542/m.3680 type:complete len:105 (-) Transcript_2542:18-332(-)